MEKHNKKIHQWLGLCWHEFEFERSEEAKYKYSKTQTTYYFKCVGCGMVSLSNLRDGSDIYDYKENIQYHKSLDALIPVFKKMNDFDMNHKADYLIKFSDRLHRYEGVFEILCVSAKDHAEQIYWILNQIEKD